MYRRSFILYSDYAQKIEMLSRPERGDLFTMILQYVRGEEVMSSTDLVIMAFYFIQTQLDKDFAKYNKKVVSSQENGKKGGRPRKDAVYFGPMSAAEWMPGHEAGMVHYEPPESGPHSTVGAAHSNNLRQDHQLQDYQPSVHKESESQHGVRNANTYSFPNLYVVKDKSIAPKVTRISIDPNEFFEQVWALYPVKRGKHRVSDKKRKLLAQYSFEEIRRAINRYKDEISKSSFQRAYQNGSTFFNSGIFDYLDDAYVPVEETRWAAVASGDGRVPTNRDFIGHTPEDYDALEE